MRMCQMMFAVQYFSPDEDLITACMKDMILVNRLP